MCWHLLHGFLQAGTAILLISSIACAQPTQGRIQYDPTKCKINDNGLVYIAIDRIVIRQPIANLTYISRGGKSYIETLPSPPMPEEPEGCPGNPIQGLAFNFKHISYVGGTSQDTEVNTKTDRISIVLAAGDKPYLQQNEIYSLICQRFSLLDQTQLGFRGCKKSFICDEDAAYEAIDYRSPDGIQVAIFCRTQVYCQPIPLVCNGAYLLQPNLVVSFGFSTAAFAVSDFIEADRQLRDRLNSSEVANYQWP